MMIQLLLIELTDIHSLHRELLEMFGYLTIHCTMMWHNVMFNGCLYVNKCCSNVKLVVPLCTVDKVMIYSSGINMPHS